MQVDQFDFDLPEELIALRPAVPRDSARLLYVGATGKAGHHVVSDLPEFLGAGDVLVVNTTKVIPARLVGRRVREVTDAGANTGAKVELTLTERLGPVAWNCMLKPARRVKIGDSIMFDSSDDNTVTGHVRARSGANAELEFDLEPDAMEPVLGRIGAMPLPPYIAGKRAPDARDDDDYQTLFATHAGAVAAPTAGIHFTKEMLKKLEKKGVNITYITLHIGLGTFKPILVEDLTRHNMDSEYYEVNQETAETINVARQKKKKIWVVGTSSVRALETVVVSGFQITAKSGWTDKFIYPPYHFKMCDRLITNFHQPKSTLMMLVSAFSHKDTIMKAYKEAIKKKYKFYSYGDSMLLM